jgi:hypothetical protein
MFVSIQMRKIEERIASNKVFSGIDQVTNTFVTKKYENCLESLAIAIIIILIRVSQPFLVYPGPD